MAAIETSWDGRSFDDGADGEVWRQRHRDDGGLNHCVPTWQLNESRQRGLLNSWLAKEGRCYDWVCDWSRTISGLSWQDSSVNATILELNGIVVTLFCFTLDWLWQELHETSWCTAASHHWWAVDAQVMLLSLIGPFECDELIVHPVTFQVLPPPSKHFVCAPSQIDTFDSKTFCIACQVNSG